MMGAEWSHIPHRVPGCAWVPDPDYSRQRVPPTGLVLHSGEAAARVAESALKDGRHVSYHLAWHAGLGRIVQLVSLRRRAWHAGRRGNAWWGLALPGPWDWDPRPAEQREELRRVVLALQDATGGAARWWCRHSDLEPRRKRDPGPGVRPEWMEGLGVEWGLPEDEGED